MAKLGKETLPVAQTSLGLVTWPADRVTVRATLLTTVVKTTLNLILNIRPSLNHSRCPRQDRRNSSASCHDLRHKHLNTSSCTFFEKMHGFGFSKLVSVPQCSGWCHLLPIYAFPMN